MSTDCVADEVISLELQGNLLIARKLDPDVGRGVDQRQIEGHKAGCAAGQWECRQEVDQRMANVRALTLHQPLPSCNDVVLKLA